MPDILNLRRILITQSFVTVACSVGLFFLASGQLEAFLAGAVLSAVNFSLLVYLWKGILDKKSVATTLLIIVTKYAILGGLLYVFVSEWKLSLIPLIVGLSTLVASILLVVLQKHFWGLNP